MPCLAIKSPPVQFPQSARDHTRHAAAWGKPDDLGKRQNSSIQMPAVFAELELSIIRARVKSGMANAKSKGKQIGRPHTTKESIPAIFYKHYPAFASGKMNLSELARICGLSRPTVYKYLKLVG